MMPSDINSDVQLISQIKEKQDSAAVLELVNRHTGIYINIIQQYAGNTTFNKKTNVADLKEENVINIYQWALSFDASKKMKFSSYVGEMTKYMCLNIMSRSPEYQPIEEETAVSNETSVIEKIERHSSIEEIQHEVKDTDSQKFQEIFKLRHNGKRPLSWREIGLKTNLSYEGARKIYNKYISSIKQNILNHE